MSSYIHRDLLGLSDKPMLVFSTGKEENDCAVLQVEESRKKIRKEREYWTAEIRQPIYSLGGMEEMTPLE